MQKKLKKIPLPVTILPLGFMEWSTSHNEPDHGYITTNPDVLPPPFKSCIRTSNFLKYSSAVNTLIVEEVYLIQTLSNSIHQLLSDNLPVSSHHNSLISHSEIPCSLK